MKVPSLLAMSALFACAYVAPAPYVLSAPYVESGLSRTLHAAALNTAEPQTWTGQISDSACGAKHEEAAEGQGKMPDRECTQACVRGGSKYVLVVDGKVFQIANQDQSDLAAHAGHKVQVTGELKGGAITISKIVMP